MIERLYNYRFEIFLTTQMMVLFGSLLFPAEFFENVMLPFFYLLSILAGILMISRHRKLMWFFIALFLGAAVIFGSSMINRTENEEYVLLRLSIYFVFNSIVTWNIIQQVWRAKRVTRNVIMGLMCGYISLGFLAFFLFMSIELVHPGAFQGVLMDSENMALRADSLMYYAYITLLTIGYGEIVPAIPLAQKAAVLVGLIGQFYLVIITAVVVEKYIKHSEK